MKRTRSKPSSTASAPDPATAYARSVVAGEVVACDLVRRACQRHLDDLESAPARGYHWRPEFADLIYEFFKLLKHSKGSQFAGKPFLLEPWQHFFCGSIWGWRDAEGNRRFRHAHLEVARKNGKTTVASGLGLACMVLDGEAGAEVYTVATKLDQARITHEESKRMALASPALARRLQVYKSAISNLANHSTYQPLGRDSGTLDGLNIHCAIMDEIHAWKDQLLFDVIVTATGARAQPLMIRTTTAGYDRQSIWWNLRQKCVDVLQGKRTDDRLFALVYTLDEADDWKDETVYAKPNPNLGVTVKLPDLIAERDDAVAVPASQMTFRRLKLNQLTEAVSTWLPIEPWDAAATQITPELLDGRERYVGVDMSTSRDLTSVASVYPPADRDPAGIWVVQCHAWLPEEGIDQKSDEDGKPYRQWAEDGWLTLIPGNVIRPEWIEEYIVAENDRHLVTQLIFDRARATEVIDRLVQRGFPVIGYGQGFLSMHPAVVEWERKHLGAKFAHDGSPVLRSCILNVAIDSDPAGNRKPTKKKSTGRIDAVVAGLMALGVASEKAQVNPEIILL
mgnify:FL=1